MFGLVLLTILALLGLYGFGIVTGLSLLIAARTGTVVGTFIALAIFAAYILVEGWLITLAVTGWVNYAAAVQAG